MHRGTVTGVTSPQVGYGPQTPEMHVSAPRNGSSKKFRESLFFSWITGGGMERRLWGDLVEKHYESGLGRK